MQSGDVAGAAQVNGHCSTAWAGAAGSRERERDRFLTKPRQSPSQGGPRSVAAMTILAEALPMAEVKAALKVFNQLHVV